MYVGSNVLIICVEFIYVISVGYFIDFFLSILPSQRIMCDMLVKICLGKSL